MESSVQNVFAESSWPLALRNAVSEHVDGEFWEEVSVCFKVTQIAGPVPGGVAGGLRKWAGTGGFA